MRYINLHLHFTFTFDVELHGEPPAEDRRAKVIFKVRPTRPAMA